LKIKQKLSFPISWHKTCIIILNEQKPLKEEFKMEITEIVVYPVNEDKLKAYVTLTFDNCFVVRDLKIIRAQKGYFVAMPNKKRKDGVIRDIAHPLNQKMRDYIESKVLDKYCELINSQGVEETIERRPLQAA